MTQKMQEKRKPQRTKDYSGFENENWKVLELGGKCPKTGRLSWIIQCKHCGKSGVRKATSMWTNKSCGCIRPPQKLKGKRKVADDIDRVNGYWLMRKSWAEGTRLQVGA